RWSCDLVVPASSTGLSLFAAAVDSGCISSYRTHSSDTNTTYLDCAQRGPEPYCEASIGALIYVVTRWNVYENGQESMAYSQGGLEALRADAGDRFLFSLNTICCYG